jgi:hypothetical protein
LFINGDDAQEPDLAGRKILESCADHAILLEEPGIGEIPPYHPRRT